ncbi:MAG: helix-turn-helix transcriptional regulator [Acidobacteria bacterium]|nr:helix-turn-helix transcriptional regulator [Acidobacteriota bacterium]
MSFGHLSASLVIVLRRKVSNGEWTERSLALRAGISQPHVHQVLRGIRQISPLLADRLMEAANVCVYDLLDPRELDIYLARHDRADQWLDWKPGAGPFSNH